MKKEISSSTHRGEQVQRFSHPQNVLASSREHHVDALLALPTGNDRLESGDHVLRQAQKPISTRTEAIANNPIDLWFSKKRDNFLHTDTAKQNQNDELERLVQASKQPIVLKSGVINVK